MTEQIALIAAGAAFAWLVALTVWANDTRDEIQKLKIQVWRLRFHNQDDEGEL